MSSPSNMKELLIYVEAQKKIRADGHRRLTLLNGTCSGLNDAEYNRVVTRQKSSFSKLESSLTTVCGEIIHKKFDSQNN